MQQFWSVADYLEELRNNKSLAAITMQMAADALEVTRAAVAGQVRAGKLDAVQVGKLRLVTAASVSDRLQQTAKLAKRIRKRLEQLAAKCMSIEYGVLMGEFGMKSTVPADRGRIGALLGIISQETWEEHRFLLSVIVCRKGLGQKSLPSDSFFSLAEKLDPSYPKAKSKSKYFSNQISRVHAHYCA